MWQEQDFIWAVIPQLKNGIEHFKTVATIWLAYDESKKEVLQKVIVQAKQSLGQAESAASSQLSQVDALTQSLTVRKGELDHQQINKVKELENLKSESQYIADCIETFSTALNNAQGTLRHLENKQRESQAVRDAGIGIMFIPIIGTIIGAVMVGVSQKELEDAQWSLMTAEQELQKSEASAQNYYRMLEEKKWQRTQKKDEIAQCSRTIEQIKQSLAQVYTQRTNIARAQEKLRNALYMLSTLAGRASVAKTLTLRTNINPMQEILWSGINMLRTRAGRASVAKTHTQRTNITQVKEIFWSGINMLKTLARRASVATTHTQRTNKNPMQEILWSGINMLSTLAARASVATTHTQRTNINRMQEILWSGINMLSTLAARASVATTYTPQVICLSPVVNILGEIIELMLQMQGDRRYELLSDPQVKAVILSLQEIYKRLSAIDDLQSLNEIPFY